MDYRLKPPSKTCAGTGRPLVPGSTCHSVLVEKDGDQVRLFTAARSGESGRNGNTVGTYICADLACSLIIRITPPASVMQPDPAAVVAARAEGLYTRVRNFTADIMKSA